VDKTYLFINAYLLACIKNAEPNVGINAQ